MAAVNEGRASAHLLTTLGLCARAGALIYGTDMICAEMRRGTKSKVLQLVIEASDTSENTHKKISGKCQYYKIRHVIIPYSAKTLGAAFGKGRLAAVGITDKQLSCAVEKQIKQTDGVVCP